LLVGWVALAAEPETASSFFAMSHASAFSTLASPAILVDRRKLAANIRGLQAECDRHGVELRPHIKTHKMVAVARQQLAAGARGLTCAKLGEAESMLPTGVRSLFVAHSLVDPGQAPRIAALADRLDDFRVAVTSEAQADALMRVAAAAGRKLAVMVAVDTGLGREGVRDVGAARRIAARLATNPQLELRGFYTHEGHFYSVPPDQLPARAAELVDRLCTLRDAIDPGLALWPGCSVSAQFIARAGAGRVQAVRPGAYVFGDLSLTRTTGIMPATAIALGVMATVVDRPEPGLALIDAGSKTFSSDRTADGISALAADGRDLAVVRVNEEHGYVRGSAVDALQIGERIVFTPAHVCTVINLTDTVVVTEDGAPVDTWRVDARGRTQ
jgi:D-serine deaminase-like pyridoxal phosphate-dependent protein